MKYTYTVILLNWKRPNNVITIVNGLQQYSFIEEIIVSNGHPKNQLLFKHLNKVKCYNDSKLNSIYGLDLRFLRGLNAKTNKLIILDDDLLIDCNNLTKLVTVYENNPTRIVGFEGRNMDGDGHYYKAPKNSTICDIVLTRLLVCDKELCNLFFKCKPIVENLYKEGVPYGNGEDILFSFIAKLFYKINNHTLLPTLYVNELSNQYSINSGKQHISYRKSLCSFLKKNIHLFEEIIYCSNNEKEKKNILPVKHINSTSNINFRFFF